MAYKTPADSLPLQRYQYVLTFDEKPPLCGHVDARTFVIATRLLTSLHRDTVEIKLTWNGPAPR